MLRSVQALGLLALLCYVAAQPENPPEQPTEQPDEEPEPEPEKIKVRFVNGTRAEAVYEKSSTLESIFGDNLVMVVENPGDQPLAITYSLYLNSRCTQDGDEIELLGATETTVAPGGENINIIQVQTGTDEIRCGPACMFATVSSDAMSGFAATGLLSKCDDVQVDLSLDTSFDNAKKTYKVDLGESLLQGDLAPLQDLKVTNHGPHATPLRSSELAQSVLAFVRIEPVTMEDVVEHLTLNCYERYYDDYEDTSVSPPPDGYSQKRSVKKRSTFRQKRESEEMYGGVGHMFEEWNMKRDALKIKEDDIPACVNKSLLMIEKDLKLTGGDIIIEQSIGKDESVPVDLSNVKLEAHKRTLCSWHTRRDATTSMHTAELILTVDPLRMNDDSDLCNNAIAINITYDCDGFYGTEYDQQRCVVVTDPVAKGHRAALFFEHEPQVAFDGDKIYRLDPYGCLDPEYYITMTEMNRWKLLEDRYQKASENDPQVCEEADNQEDSRQREMVVNADEEAKLRPKSEEQAQQQGQRRRRKRQLGAPTGGTDGGQLGGHMDAKMVERKANLTRGLEEINQGLPNAEEKRDESLAMWCKFQGLRLQYNMLKLHLEDGDPLHQLYEDAKAVVDDLDNIHDLVGEECSESSKGPEVDLDDISLPGLPEESVDGLKDFIREKDEDSQAAEDGDLYDKLDFLGKEMENMNKTCPGKRGRTPSAAQSSSSQLLGVLEKGYDAKQEDVEISELPEETCGTRKLQAILDRGLGKFLNRDIKSFAVAYTGNDKAVDEMRYMRTLADVLEENKDNPDMEYFDIQDEADRRMNETAKQEMERCTGEGEDDTMYKPDNTYSIYWRLKEGKIYQGIPDTDDSRFGNGNGGGKNIVWKQVATCSCSHCDSDRMIDPHWDDDYDYDDYDYSGYYSHYGDMLGSTTAPGFL